MKLGVRAALVDGTIVDGDVELDDARVVSIGVAPAGRRGLAVPGFVDLQVNGFAGVHFPAADLDGYRIAHAALARTGVSAYQATLVSAPIEEYGPALAVAAAARELPGPELLGVHLEGPFLAPAKIGAHVPGTLRKPDIPLARQLVEAGPVTYMTLAPELPGALELIDALVARGVIVALGHSDADAATAHAAIDRGARGVTHIWNAQHAWRPRDPGIAGACLVRSEITVQAIVDHVHLAPETAYATFLATRGRFALVTDAVGFAGMADGEYPFLGRTVRVTDGAVRLEDGTLAGSVLTMDTAVRNLVGLGASLVDAAEAASRVPARLLGRDDLGTLRPGARADVAVLDDELRIGRTLVRGAEVFCA